MGRGSYVLLYIDVLVSFVMWSREVCTNYIGPVVSRNSLSRMSALGVDGGA